MNNVYEVERQDYVAFLDQIQKNALSIKEESNEGVYWIKSYSKKHGNLLCVREIYESGKEHYYVFDMPQDDERRSPPARQKFVLETPEEVQIFFDILSQMKKKESEEND